MTRQDFLDLIAKFQESIPCSEESGLRTPEHNRNVGGSADSAHIHGLAIDLVLDSIVKPEGAIAKAKQLGFCGIEWDERNYHLHLDMHPSNRHWWVRIDQLGVSHNLSVIL